MGFETGPQPEPPKEILDIVDANGDPTGEQHEKSFVHAAELWHRDVHVWVTDGENMLEQQRAYDKSIMPGAWDITVAGHVNAGESFAEAAQRETSEEIGLDFPLDRFLPAGKMAFAVEMPPDSDEPDAKPWVHRTVGDNYVVVEENINPADLQLQESEVADARLYPLNQLEEDITNPETAHRHAPQPRELWLLGIAAMRAAAAEKKQKEQQ